MKRIFLAILMSAAVAYNASAQKPEKAFYDILLAVSKKYEFEYPEDKMIALSKGLKIGCIYLNLNIAK